MRKFNLRAASSAILAAGLLSLTACGGASDTATKTGDAAASSGGAAAAASDLDPNLANPQAGDLYAAELTAFSTASFSGPGAGGSETKAFGLLKVVAVDATTVTVITEQGAWPEAGGATRDLASDMSTITWDESERITIQRADFARLVEEDKIIETRRMAAAGQ